ncbi:hypothetical protein [Methylobacterium sp. WL7]|uniref:hypothetical protein n=1 Tax=Methylobacterium sp. WL7 TaxID=2603900 RepID=UPI0011CB09BB|nr:hypothetical protein [Methylobacterium sp. WL7]TXN43591.1 hypothetical protein FV233_18000 [Methylobacterium sp. WL7]
MSGSAVPAVEPPPLAVPFGAWEPDRVAVDSASAAIARNVFPQANGYGPVPSPVPVTLPLPGVCRGSISVRLSTGAWVVYAGTATKLYRFNGATLGWDDVSGPSAYLLPPEDYWSFALYGSKLIAVHTGARPQTIDIAAPPATTKFADLAYTSPDPPPNARFVAIVNEFVMLGGLLGNEAAVQWSGIGDPSYWTPGINDSDIQILPDGGRVTGLVGGEVGVVFQERAIQQFVFAAGTGEVFQRTKLEEDRGAVAPWSIVKIGAIIYFLDRDGFYAFQNGASVPIGQERVNRWMLANRDPTYIQTCVATSDPTGTRVFWAFKSKTAADPTSLDRAIVYDFVLDRWTNIDVFVRHWLRAETAPLSFDNVSEDIDRGTTPYGFVQGLSSDSALFSGGVPLVGVFGADNRLALLEGASLEARIGTAWVQTGRPRRAYADGVRVDTDAAAWFATVSTRESLAVTDAPRPRPESAPNKERFAPCRASGRYHQVDVRIAAGDPWTYAQAVEPMLRSAEGMR